MADQVHQVRRRRDAQQIDALALHLFLRSCTAGLMNVHIDYLNSGVRRILSSPAARVEWSSADDQGCLSHVAGMQPSEVLMQSARRSHACASAGTALWMASLSRRARASPRPHVACSIAAAVARCMAVASAPADPRCRADDVRLSRRLAAAAEYRRTSHAAPALLVCAVSHVWPVACNSACSAR